MNIRTATKQDSDLIAPLVLSSGKTTLSVMLGGVERSSVQALDFLKQAISQPEGQFGYNNHLVVCDADDATLAVGCCWGDTPKAGFRESTMESLIDYFGVLETMNVLECSQQVAKIIPGPKSDELCLGHIAVGKKRRRQGVATKLLDYFSHYALTQNKHKLVLDVEATNIPALMFYRQYGFSEVARTEPDASAATLGLTAHWHMRKDLN
jgi:ribosomal protein S18 acetylase RimI-like enzyme